MNCPNCKVTVSSAAKFCTNCGTKINQQTATPAATSTAKPVTQSIKPIGGTTYCNVCGEPIIGKSCKTCDSTASITSPTQSTNSQISRPTSGSGISNKTQTPTSNQKKCPKCGTSSSLRVCTSCGEKLDQSSSSTTSTTSSSSTGSKSRPPSTSMPAPVKTTTTTPISSPSKNVDNSNSTTSVSKPQTTSTPSRATISTPSSTTTQTTSSSSFSEKKCPSCSTLNTTKFCTACGTKIDDASSSSNGSSTAPKAATESTSSSTKQTPAPAKQTVPPPPPKQTAPPAAQPTQTVPPPPPKQTTPPPPPPAKQAIPPPPPKQTVPPPPPPKQSGAPVRGPGQGIPPPPPKNTIPPPPPPKKSSVPPPPSTPKPPAPQPATQEDPKMKQLMEENERLKKQLDEVRKEQLKQAQNQSLSSSQSSVAEEEKTPAEPAAERSWKKKVSQAKALRESSDSSSSSSYSSRDSARDSSRDSSRDSVVEDSSEDHASKHRSWKKKYETIKTTPNNAGEASKKQNMGSVRYRTYTDTSMPPRERVVREILETEADYVADLETIVNVFLNPLRKEQITTPDDIIGIFSNIEYILAVNKQLLEDLQTNGGKNIGNVFLKKKDYLRVYSTYCSNQQTSLDIMQRLHKKEKKFESFLEYTYARPECNNLDLGSFMIKPIQRICKYPLLMKELLKQTDESHEEYQQTKDALLAIEDLLSQINEKKRDAESVQKVIELTKVLVGAEGHKLVEPTRRYIKEGEMSHYTTNKKDTSKKEKEGYFFLFNDVFIYCKKKGSKFKMLAFISLKTADTRVAVTYEKPCFELINTQDNTVWPLIMNSQDQMVAFMGEIQTLIDKTQNRGTLRQSVKTQKLDDTITFECEYTEKKSVQMNRNQFTYEELYYAIADVFGVQAITIMYGEYYISSQQDVDNILAEGKSFYNFLIYDYYGYSEYPESDGQYQQ